MASDTPRLASVPPEHTRSVTRMLRGIIRNPLLLIGTIFVIFLAYVALSNLLSGEFTIERFVRQMIFGLAQGSIYALIALGYTLVYGILSMINFAHGEVFMSGAYIGFFAINAMDQVGLVGGANLPGAAHYPVRWCCRLCHRRGDSRTPRLPSLA